MFLVCRGPSGSCNRAWENYLGVDSLGTWGITLSFYRPFSSRKGSQVIRARFLYDSKTPIKLRS